MKLCDVDRLSYGNVSFGICYSIKDSISENIKNKISKSSFELAGHSLSNILLDSLWNSIVREVWFTSCQSIKAEIRKSK